jgi:hypothetical protein
MKNALILLSIWSFSCATSCTNEPKSDKKQPIAADTLIAEQAVRSDSGKIDSHRVSDRERIFVDSFLREEELLSDSGKIDIHRVGDREMIVLQGKDTVEVFRKVGFDKTFEDFKVKLYKGKKAPLNYQSHRIAREYKTVITSEYEREQVNFAGHYIIASWRCGAPCSDFAIIDVKTGQVYYDTRMMNIGYIDYQPDSKLLIIGRVDSLGWYPTINTYPMPPAYYLWENNRMINLWTEPDFR